MSDVTDMRCDVSSGDFAAGVSSASLPLPLVVGIAGTSGIGESARESSVLDVELSRLLRSDLERERSDCDSGRGVLSEASSKLSCRATYQHQQTNK